jgi:hypothetical protein
MQYVGNHTDEVLFRLLDRVPDASVGEDSGSVIVDGDYLEALKALPPYYREQVKPTLRVCSRGTGIRKISSTTQESWYTNPAS